MMTMHATTEVDRTVADMMTGLSRRRRRQVAALMTTIDVAPGQDVIVEGQPGRSFFVVGDGHLEVSVGGELVADLQPGDFCGEIALLAGRLRTATVSAPHGARLEAMNRREFASVMDLWPVFAHHVTRRAATRLADLR